MVDLGKRARCVCEDDICRAFRRRAWPAAADRDWVGWRRRAHSGVPSGARLPMQAKLPATLSAPWVEETLLTGLGMPDDQLPLRPDHAQLELGGWRRTRFFAEARLMGALAAVRQHGYVVDATFGRELPAVGETGAADDERWRLLRDQLTGLLVSEVAERLTDRTGADRLADVRRAQYRVLGEDERRGLVASGAVAIPGLDRIAAPPPHPLFATARRSTLGQRRSLALATIFQISAGTGQHGGYGVLNLPRIEHEHEAALVDFVHEAIENTRDHARADFRGQAAGLRFLLVRRVRLVPTALEGLRDAAGPAGLGGWFEAVAKAGDAAKENLVEVSVADCGPGIPARLVGDADVYRGPVAEEHRVLERAMADGETSKPAGIAGAGLGLGAICAAVDQLGGFLSLRTGRSELTRDGRRAPGAPSWELNERGYLAGTAVSVLLPWVRLAARPDAPGRR